MKKKKSPKNALLLLLIVQIALLNMIAPGISSNNNVKVITELIPLPQPSDENWRPTSSILPRSSPILEYVSNQWIIPSHMASELMRDGIVIDSRKDLPELDLTIIEVNSSENSLKQYPHVFQNRIIRKNALFSAKASNSERYTLETTLEWVGAKELHKNGVTGAGVAVAILDSGISTHDLVSPLSDSYSYVDPDDGYGTRDGIGHGTAVASIISQVAPGASLYNFRVFDKAGNTEITWILEALNDIVAINETIDIVQMSFGGYGVIDEMNSAMDHLILAGLIPVVAAGNSGPYGQSISRPAHSPSTIAIGAAASPDEIAPFSSQGPRLYGLAAPDLIAPGYAVEVASLENGGATTYQNGTSFAAPFASGGVALLLSGDSSTKESKNETRFWKLKAALMAGAKPFGQYQSVAVGAGFIDLEAAFETLNDDVVVSMAPQAISASNYFFQISTNGQAKKFPISIYSAEEYSMSYPDFELPSGVIVNLSIPDKIRTGLNILNLSIELPKDLEMDNYEIDLDLQISSKLLTLEIDLETRYTGGRILWDLRYDNDTNSAAFSNGYFGDNSFLGYLLSTIGLPSAAIVGNRSDFYGTGYTYQGEEIIQALEKHDLLIISDPEFHYSSNEISIIQSWVSQGKSLLIISDLDNQTNNGVQEGTEHDSLNTLLANYGIKITNRQIPAEQNKTVLGTTIPQDGSTINPFSSQFNFDFIGVALDVTENSNTRTIASFGNDVIAAANRNSTSGGTVAVVGSTFPFSNLAYYVPNGENNFRFSFQIIDWLLNVQQPIVRFTYSTNPLEFLGFDTESTFSVDLSEREGRPINESQLASFPGTLIESNGHYIHLAFRKKGDKFEASWKPTTSGQATLYVSIQIPGYAPLNGALQVDVQKAGFPIFLALIIVLVVLIVGFFIYSSRKRDSSTDFMRSRLPRTKGASIEQKRMLISSKTIMDASSPDKDRCISCGTALFSGAAFCEKCGTRQAPKEKTRTEPFCQMCGSPLRRANAHFCEFCGNKLEGKVD